jgi:hypothetical protein
MSAEVPDSVHIRTCEVIDVTNFGVRHKEMPFYEIIVGESEQSAQGIGSEVGGTGGRRQEGDNGCVFESVLNNEVIRDAFGAQLPLKLVAGGPAELLGEAAHSGDPDVRRTPRLYNLDEVVVPNRH